MRIAAALLFGLLSIAQPAAAETRSVSHSIWAVAESRVTVRYILPADETRQISDRGSPPPSNDKVAAYVLDRLSVSSAGAPCAAIDQGYDIGRIDTLSVGAGLVGFEIIFQCPAATGLMLRNRVLFDRAPLHVDFARIETQGAQTAQIFTSASQQLQIPDLVSPASAGIGAYLRLGLQHMLHSLDRLCFLIGVVVLARGRRELLIPGVALLLGYIASIVVSLGGYAIPSTPAVEASVGFLVALLAMPMAAALAARSAPTLLGVAMLLLGAAALLLRNFQAVWLCFGLGIFAVGLTYLPVERRRLTLLVLPAVFGFLDGFVLPGDYARLQLWQAVTGVSLVGFAAGALLTAVFLVAFLAVLPTVLRAALGSVTPASLMRHGRLARLGVLGLELAATTLTGMGSFWMLSRLLG